MKSRLDSFVVDSFSGCVMHLGGVLKEGELDPFLEVFALIPILILTSLGWVVTPFYIDNALINNRVKIYIVKYFFIT